MRKSNRVDLERQHKGENKWDVQLIKDISVF